jgi:hypothetical protein
MRRLLVLLMSLLLGVAASGQVRTPRFVRSRIDQTLGGWHATTRGTVRLVHVHDGRWLVFRGGPNAYHVSRDGVTWARTEAEQASRSHYLDGDTIYTQYSIDTDPAPDKWDFVHFVATGTIADGAITWDPGVEVPMRLSYYPDIQRDGSGRFSMTGRAVMSSDGGEMTGEEMLWIRSQPGDFLKWEKEVRCFQHTGDPVAGRWKQIGSVAHENLSLVGDRSYLLAMMTHKGKGLLLGRQHDGRGFVGEEVVLDERMSTWRGTDKRMSACFDAGSGTIHLVYVTHDGRVWYQSCSAPYGAEDWSTPRRIGAENSFTAVLSLDQSTRPARVWVLYGETRHLDPEDQRQAWGDLHLISRGEMGWSDPILVSEPGEHENWYPNMNEDVARGFGILYLAGGQEGPTQGGKRVLDIMFASTGAPVP